MKITRLTAVIGPIFCWFSAALVALVCLSLILYPLIMGVKMLSLNFLLTDPKPSFSEALSGGILTPIIGTVVLTVIGILVTIPLAMGAAIYLSEYVKKENFITGTIRLGLDVLAGVPSIVFAIFGLAVFSFPTMAFLSSKGADAAQSAFGRSFLVGAIIMALHILPFVIKAIEEALKTVPSDYRQAALALGATKWSTIRRVILPAARPGIITAIILGMALIIGDTAIVWLGVGGSMTMTGSHEWWLPANWLATLKGTGSTLTTFIYFSSPAGEGNASQKAFGAAFVLMIIVLALNLTVDFVAKRRKYVN